MSRLLAPALGLLLALTAITGAARADDPTRVATAPAAGHLLMMDARSAPSLEDLQVWDANSEYEAIGVYIPVAAGYDVRSDKIQGNLDDVWVRGVRALGWKIVPIYVGLQAPCSAYSKTFSANATTAANQGTAMATDAANSAYRLGLSIGTPIVYDLEAYPTDKPACRAAVQVMQHNWTRRLHQLGRNSAIYGSVSSTISHIVQASQADDTYAKPDAVWVAKWDAKADTNLDVLAGGLWAGRRAHQYLGGADEQYPAGTGPTIAVDQSAVQPGFFTLPKPDIAAPTLADNPISATSKARTTLNWKMRDSSGIARYEVQLKTRKRWTSPRELRRTTTTSRRVTLTAGAKACARVRGTDKVGNTSAWITTCVHRWGSGKVFRGKTWRASGSHAVSSRPGRAQGPKVSGTQISVQTRGRVAGQILLNGKSIGSFTGAGTHRVTFTRVRTGRLGIRTTSRGKVTVVRYLVTG